MVDQVLLTSLDDDQLMVKVLMRSTRRPEIGDKFSSRHGQKVGLPSLSIVFVDTRFSRVCAA
jgi:DNA-directed RNA polymerase beta subunit